MTDKTIDWYGDSGIGSANNVGFTFESTDSPRDLQAIGGASDLDWTDTSYELEGYSVFPYGNNNDLPKVIKDSVQGNYIAPGVLKKKTQLLWGKGPKLYTEKFEDGILVREWIKDDQVQAWLDSWEYEKYLSQGATDIHHIESSWTKFFRDRGSRMGRASKIAKLEHVNMNRTRLARVSGSRSKKPTHGIYTLDNLEARNTLGRHTVYPLFDRYDPFKHATSLFYSGTYTFLSDNYAIPDLYGTLEWLRRSTAIPLILKALSENSINLKYHIISPQAFWDAKEKELQDAAKSAGTAYKAKDLIKFKTKYMRKVVEVLSGAHNTGKFWHTVKYVRIDGNTLIEEGWEIKEIKQNVKDFVEAQTMISDQSTRAITAGLGIHQALGGSGEKGKTDSGGEQHNALKNYLITGIDMPEMTVCAPINYALKVNFPKKDIKIGFYHIAPQREQEITESKRLANNIG